MPRVPFVVEGWRQSNLDSADERDPGHRMGGARSSSRVDLVEHLVYSFLHSILMDVWPTEASACKGQRLC